MKTSLRQLAFDIETSPILGYAFSLYDTNIIHVQRDVHLMAFSWQWVGEKKIHSKCLADYKGYKNNPYDDTALLKDLHALMESADVLIAQNGDRFDVKVANSRFIKMGLPTLDKKHQIDTLKIAKSRFKFTSNKLTDLAQFAKVGKKLPTDKDLWVDCLNGDMRAWRRMKRYNEHDVRLLMGVYEWLRPWSERDVNRNVSEGKSWACPRCGSSKLEKRGQRFTRTGKYQSYFCKDCRGWSQGSTNLLDAKVRIK